MSQALPTGGHSGFVRARGTGGAASSAANASGVIEAGGTGDRALAGLCVAQTSGGQIALVMLQYPSFGHVELSSTHCHRYCSAQGSSGS